jgi:hypothetical protein
MQMLYTRKAGNKKIVWEQVQTIFVKAGNSPDYTFCLLNLLFSDALFVPQFNSIAWRCCFLLTSKFWTLEGKLETTRCWEQGHTTFVKAGNNPDYSCLQLMDDKVFCYKEKTTKKL